MANSLFTKYINCLKRFLKDYIQPHVLSEKDISNYNYILQILEGNECITKLWFNYTVAPNRESDYKIIIELITNNIAESQRELITEKLLTLLKKILDKICDNL